MKSHIIANQPLAHSQHPNIIEQTINLVDKLDSIFNLILEL